MAAPRKTLGSRGSPYIQPLAQLLAAQDKTTVASWCIGYAQEHLLPIYETAYPGDARPRHALAAARDWLAGRVKLPAVKHIILNECHAAAREAEANPAAQAAARACGQAASCIHTPGHALGIVFYGTAAIAYARVGTGAAPAVYQQIAAEECARMERDFQKVAG